MDRSEENIEQEPTPEDDSGEESSHPMDALLEDKDYGVESPRRGEIRTGTIARITENDVLVDIGYKSEGVIPTRELEQLPEEKRAELTIGSEVTVFVLRTGNTILLSLSRAEQEKDWIDAQDLLKSKEIFEGEISGYNKGGLIVKMGSIRGFVPASQVSIARRWRSDGDSPDQRWGKMVGEPIATKVIEVERRRNRLILSERAAAREARDMLKERLIEELEVGEVRKGHVISLADFGAFVDIGGADGLVHTSEISWKRISHPREVLKVGQEVEVRVLSVDPDRKRISLSIRELLPDPWETIVDQFKEGQLVEGVVTKLTKFGAFASLRGTEDFELEGLIHISELSERHIVHPRELVSESETLTLRIIRIDKERRRIGLSLKRVDSPEYAELDWQAAMEEFKAEDTTEEAAEEEVQGQEEDDQETPDEPSAKVDSEEAAETREQAEQPDGDFDPEESEEDTETQEAVSDGVQDPAHAQGAADEGERPEDEEVDKLMETAPVEVDKEKEMEQVLETPEGGEEEELEQDPQSPEDDLESEEAPSLDESVEQSKGGTKGRPEESEVEDAPDLETSGESIEENPPEEEEPSMEDEPKAPDEGEQAEPKE